MEMILIIAAVFMAGALVGFGLATIYSSNQVITLWDEKKKLNRELIDVMAEKQSLEEVVKNFKPTTIEISDPTVGNTVKFGGF